MNWLPAIAAELAKQIGSGPILSQPIVALADTFDPDGCAQLALVLIESKKDQIR